MRAVCIQLVMPMPTTIRMKMPVEGPKAARKGSLNRVMTTSRSGSSGSARKRSVKPHQRPVEPPPVAGGDANRSAERKRQRHRGEADRQRHAAARQHRGEEIASEIVGAERMNQGRRQVPLANADPAGIDAMQIGADEDREHDGDEDEQPKDAAGMTAELSPDLPPGWPGNRLRIEGGFTHS